VFEKLIRKFGEERLSALVPPEHFKFWSHLVKTRRRDRYSYAAIFKLPSLAALCNPNFCRRQALEGRITSKGKAEADEEDALDDLFGDVGSDDGSSGSSDGSESDDLALEAVSRKPGRVGGAARASGGDLGDGLTLHDGRLVVEVAHSYNCQLQHSFSFFCRSTAELSGAAVKMWLLTRVTFSVKLLSGWALATWSVTAKKKIKKRHPKPASAGAEAATSSGPTHQRKVNGACLSRRRCAPRSTRRRASWCRTAPCNCRFIFVLGRVLLFCRFQAPRAGGDLSRPNHQAPFAYVPLDKSAMKNKRDPNVRKAFAKLGAKGGSGH
jgi:hypothetical protein